MGVSQGGEGVTSLKSNEIGSKKTEAAKGDRCISKYQEEEKPYFSGTVT